MKYLKTILPNGLRVITVPLKDNPTVTFGVYIRAGSLNETKETSGLAHFLEHMCFKGTTKRPTANSISLELDSIGASYNASTGRDCTIYYAKADAEHFEKIADVISDIALNSTFPEKEMEKEKGVILGEIAMYEDEPQEKVWEILNTLMYGDQPAGWEIIGTKENVQSFNRNDIKTFCEKYYKTKNMVVAIAGGIEEEKAIEVVNKLFSSQTMGEYSPALKTVETQKTPQLKILDKKTDQAHLVLSFRAFNRFDKDLYVFWVMRTILRGGMSSRLFVKLREEMGAGYYVGAGYSLHDTYGSFTLNTGTDPKKVLEVLEAILNEVRRLKTEKVGDEELKKVKDYIRGKRAMSLETSDDVADFFAEQEIISGEIKTQDDYEKILAGVTSEDIMRVANRVFVNEGMNLAMVASGQDTEKISSILKL
jgi:predicted Zn-dependent peptidase